MKNFAALCKYAPQGETSFLIKLYFRNVTPSVC